MEIWVESFRKSLQDDLNDGCNKWLQVVNTLGLSENERKSWMGEFHDEIQCTLTNILVDVRQKEQDLLDKLELLIKEAEQLCRTLQIPLPKFGENNLGLYPEHKQLTKHVEEWKAMVNERMKEILAIKQKRDSLCKSLAKKPFDVIEDPLPSAQKLQKYHAQLEALESEWKSRLKKFQIVRRDICNIVNEIEFEPELDFQKMVIESEGEEFEVHDDNMRELYGFLQYLQDRKEQITSDLVEYREKLDQIWQTLEEDRKYCSDFVKNYHGNNMTTLNAFKKEVKRCEAIKKANIKVYVTRLRKELLEQWELCGISEEEKEQFEYFNDDLYTEDLLMLHENELERIKAYKTQNGEFFNCLEKLEELWQKYRDLEKRARDPNRFKNRGGQLLKEEKERKAVHAKIPHIEEKLHQLAMDYENANDKEFKYKGKTVQEIINEHRSHVDEKSLKLSARKQTPSASRFTAMTSRAHRTALTPLSKCNTIRSPRTAPIGKVVKRRSITKTKCLTEKKRQLKNLSKRLKPEDMEGYCSFVSDLSSKKDRCRSTLTPLTAAAALSAKKWKPTPSTSTSTKGKLRVATSKKLMF